MGNKHNNIAKMVGAPFFGMIVTVWGFFMLYGELGAPSYRVVLLFISLILLSNFSAQIVERTIRFRSKN
jgi:hypothetical protein